MAEKAVSEAAASAGRLAGHGDDVVHVAVELERAGQHGFQIGFGIGADVAEDVGFGVIDGHVGPLLL